MKVVKLLSDFAMEESRKELELIHITCAYPTFLVELSRHWICREKRSASRFISSTNYRRRFRDHQHGATNRPTRDLGALEGEGRRWEADYRRWCWWVIIFQSSIHFFIFLPIFAEKAISKMMLNTFRLLRAIIGYDGRSIWQTMQPQTIRSLSRHFSDPFQVLA